MKIRTGEIADKDKDKKIVSSVKLSKGTRVGTLKLTVNGEEQDSVPVKGLGGGSSTVIGGSVDTQALWDAINKKVDIDFFKNLFTVYDSSDIEIATNTYTRKPDNLKISVGTWTEEYLSALGKNSEDGGGGGVGTVIGIALGTGTTPIYPDDDTGIVTLPAYPTKVSQLANDSGFVTSSTLNNYVTSSYLANNFYTKAQADSKYMTIAAFESLFNALDSNGDKINHPYSSGVDSIKALVGLWTEEYLSALGQNSEGGSSGGGSVNAIKVGTNPDTYLDPVEGIIDMSNYVTTAAQRTLWTNSAHTHSNKAVLDNITAGQVAAWNNMAAIMEEDQDNIINKWNEVVDFLSTYTEADTLANLLSNKLDVEFFRRIFTVYDEDGNIIVPNTYTQVADNLKILVGTWTEEYLSALGKNSEGGGGGTGTVTAIKIASNPDVFIDPVDGIIDMSSYATTWNNKQDAISDLATIRSNASNGNTAYGYFTSGIANNAARLSNTTKIGDTNQPVYFSASGVPVAISYTIGKSVPTNAVFTDTTYKLTLNGTTNGASGGTSLGSFYAPTASGTANQVLISGGSNTAPSWTAQSNLSVGTAAKLGTGTTTYTAWGQTYWSSGVPQSISGNMTSVGSITPSANGNALGTTSARFAIYGTSGNFSGNVSIGGTLGVTGATTLSSSLSVASGITLTTTKKIYFGDTSHYIELTSTGFHFSHGVYSDSFVSALGANSSGGGGGGIDIEAMWAELQGNTGTYANAKINVNHIPDISSTYGYAKTSQLGNYLPLSGGTMSNTNLVTNLNADLLDGQHASYFAAMHTQDNYDLNEIGTSGGIYRHGDAPTNAFPSAAYGNTLVVGAGSSSDTCFQLGAPYGSSNLYFRTGTWYSNGTGTIRTNSWRQVAFTDSNVASATKLHTPRTIWGQSFDGSADISTSVVAKMPYVLFKNYNDTGNAGYCGRGSTTSNDITLIAYTGQLILGSNGSALMYLSASNNVGIGTTSPSYKLDVDGDVRADNFRGSLIGNAATATKATQDGSGNTITSTYLPLSGGTLTGALTIATGVDRKLIINNTDTETKYSLISFRQNGTEYGTLGTPGTDNLTWNGNILLHTANYNSYAPTLTGTGASGTWGISVTGNAATATKATQDNDGNAFQGYYLRKVTVPNNTANDFNTFENMTLTGRGDPTTGASLSHAPWTGSGPAGGYGVLSYLWSGYGIQMAWGYANNHIYIRNKYFNSGTTVWSDSWSTIALTSDNVASATKLQTPRTIWGQSFDGTGNVSGTLTDTGSILPLKSVTHDIGSNALAYRYVYATWVGSPTNKILQFGANSQYHITVTTGGNVGIGNTSPSQKLHVTGNILASGEVTASSDERLKIIVGDGNLDLRYIANAPNILFKWNNGQDDKVHGGSLAQYFLTGAKHFVLGSDKDYYSLNYGALATSMAISIAKEVVKHEDRITLLEKENARLKARVAELEERRA